MCYIGVLEMNTGREDKIRIIQRLFNIEELKDQAKLSITDKITQHFHLISNNFFP